MVAALVLGTGVGSAQTFGGALARHLQLDWEVTPGRGGRPVISGYVSNTYGLPAAQVQLLVEVLDAGGRAVTEVIGYVDSRVPPQGQAYFEVSVPKAGASYRVTVHYFDWLVE